MPARGGDAFTKDSSHSWGMYTVPGASGKVKGVDFPGNHS